MPVQFGDDKPDSSSAHVGRKRRRPTPGFGIPPPFSPITGTHATLRTEGVFPYCAMMQVAASDTYEDYVICRGFDPRQRKFIDYAAGDTDKPGISVAKPYGNRTVGAYTVAEVYPAFLPTQGADDYTPPSPTAVDWRVGQNAGTASTAHTGGQPTALVDTITELVDHNGVNVQWMLVDRGGTTTNSHFWGKATANWTDNGASCDHVTVNPCDDCEGANPTAAVVTVLLPKSAEQDPNVVSGDIVSYTVTTDATNVCVSDYLDEKIGTVKMWALGSAQIQPGWAVMNGSDNAAPNGTGFDLTDKFVRGHSSSGGTGGTASHTHTFTFTIEPHTVAELAISLDHDHVATTFPHTVEELRHEHPIALGTPFDEGDILEKDKPTTCTGWPLADFGAEGSCSGDSWGPLNHVIDVEPAYGGGVLPSYDLHHQFYLVIDEEEHLPEYMEMIFIERIDNSA